ncbi:major facilitator superfamily domain-containing protein [Chaetomium fimeti]|uniref:Major facilitator superfamily domain-containing protein n=1 Tax=Chaetomium fimeti TaxID=1854472 RepID=A0AAE0H981_9PEZI|nr:major facilitator superfamily domain-containing protein [Chaetomium fimeti]
MDPLSGIRLQLCVLGLVRFTEAIAWSSMIPYTYAMMRQFDVPEHDIAFYAGALVTVLTSGEFLTGPIWTRVGDKIGRKPTLLFGIFCGLITSLTLGLSQSFTVVIVSRALAGLLNPNAGLVQTCTEELAREEQRHEAFTLVIYIRSLGGVLGPILGGFLAYPTFSYPSTFSQNSLWADYPHLLPNLAVCLLHVVTFILAARIVEETHPKMPAQQFAGLSVSQILKKLLIALGRTNNAAHVPVPEDLADSEAQENTTKKVSDSPFTFLVILQILAVSLLALHHAASDSLMVAFLALGSVAERADEPGPRSMSSPQATTEFCLTPPMIGLVLCMEAMFRVFIHPDGILSVVSTLGARRAFRLVLGLYPAMYIFTPFLPRLPTRPMVWLLAFDMWIKLGLSSIGYMSSTVLITKISPSSQALAKINGAAASFVWLAKSLGPLFIGKVYAAGFHTGYPQIPFWTLGAVALVGAVVSAFLVDHP